MTQAAWDFAKFDLQSPPFNYDSGTAFVIANKLFYQGSGNVGLWYLKNCPESSGCNADSGYLQWLAADDDNGNLLDGTPHMTALYAAFNRHGIACEGETVTAFGEQIVTGTVVPPTSVSDTWESDDVREILEEGLVGGQSRLEHVWQFGGLLPDVPRWLIVEGYRPNNTEGDNFQFFYSTDGITFTLIPNAVINKLLEPAGGVRYSFGAQSSGTIHIKVKDTVATGGVLDRVYIDFLAIGQISPIPQDSGCPGGPLQAPTLTAAPGSYQVSLSWTAVPQAVKYWVFRTEGHAGCNLGKALIANPAATSNPSYIDGEVAAGRQYCYAVMAAAGNGSESSRCFGRSSTCQCVTPF